MGAGSGRGDVIAHCISEKSRILAPELSGRGTQLKYAELYGRPLSVNGGFTDVLRPIVAWRKNSRGWQRSCAKTGLVKYSTVYKVS